jgi:hypothetical protein
MGTAPAPRTAATASPCDVKRNCQRCRWFRAAKGRGMRPQSKRHCAACGTYLRPTARFDDWHGGSWTPEENESDRWTPCSGGGPPERGQLLAVSIENITESRASPRALGHGVHRCITDPGSGSVSSIGISPGSEGSGLPPPRGSPPGGGGTPDPGGEGRIGCETVRRTRDPGSRDKARSDRWTPGREVRLNPNLPKKEKKKKKKNSPLRFLSEGAPRRGTPSAQLDP